MTKNVYWDSCVFYSLLTGQPPQHQANVLELLNDAKTGLIKIHSSTVAFAEFRPSALKMKNGASIATFFDTMQSVVRLVDPNPNIMMAVGELRDSTPTNPSNATTPNKRSIGLGDAIHLETCLYIKDALGVKDIVFQTFDDGKGKNWEGRCVPLLSFELWFPEARNKRIKDVCDLPRKLPKADQSSLFTPAITYAGTGTSFVIGGGNQGKPS